MTMQIIKIIFSYYCYFKLYKNIINNESIIHEVLIHTFFYNKPFKIIFNMKWINKICFEEVKEKSSHYGLKMLGYTCATKLKTTSCKN